MNVFVTLFVILHSDISDVGCGQPGSSGRDVDVARQEAVGATDSVKWKSSGTTRASPALAHGADEGYSVVKEQPDIAVTAANESDGLAAAAAASQGKTAATTAAAEDDRPSAKNSHHGVRSLKHTNDRSYKYGTGSADLHRTASLQDLSDGAVERSHRPLVENTVSSGRIDSDAASDTRRLRSMYSLPSDACSANAACIGYDGSLTTFADEQASLSPHRSRCRMRCPATNLELQSIGSTGIVSNTAQFWEDMVLCSNSSAARCGVRPRHASEDRRRFVCHDDSSQRYSIVGAPCDVDAVHGMVCVPASTLDVLSRSESLHGYVDHEVCSSLLC